MSSYVPLSSQYRLSPRRRQCQHLTSCSLLNPCRPSQNESLRMRLPRLSVDAEVEHIQLEYEVSHHRYYHPNTWKVPCPVAVAMLTSESGMGEEFIHLRLYQLHHLIVALSQHKIAEYVNSSCHFTNVVLTIVCSFVQPISSSECVMLHLESRPNMIDHWDMSKQY